MHAQVEAIRGHIRAFKQQHDVDRIVVLWTANTERYAQVRAAFFGSCRSASEPGAAARRTVHPSGQPSHLLPACRGALRPPFFTGARGATLAPV